MTIEKVFLGFSTGTTIFSHAIRWLDSVPVDGKPHLALINHTYLRFVWSDGGPDLVYESLEPRGIGISPTSRLDEAIRKGKVIRKIEKKLDVSPNVARIMWRRCCELDGAPYDKRLIVLYLVWIRYAKRKPKWRGFGLNHPDKFTCNEFVLHICRDYVPSLEDLGLGFTPERLFRYVFGIPSDDYVANQRIPRT